ncbi:MAG: YciI family protein [Candidatus Binataceae bacterium]
MKFMLLIVGGDPKLPQPTEAQMGPMLAQFQKIGADLGAAGKLVHSARLRSVAEAKTVKIGRDGKRTVIDGPFTETKEAVGGYYLIDCASEAEAIEWAKKFPPFFHIEVQPVWEM